MLGWLRRARARSRLQAEVGLWYHAEYAVPELQASSLVAHLRPDRGERILAHLAQRKLLVRGDVRSPATASLEELSRVHGVAYLERTLTPETLGRVFGLVPEVVDVDSLVAAQRRAVGGTVEAARAVARGELQRAVNLGGGFHHAGPDHGGGFCIYNDIAVAIASLRHEGWKGRITIVDLDFHQGDGTALCLGRDATVQKFSLHGAHWRDLHTVATVERELPPGTDDHAYLAALRATLPRAFDTHRPELVFYLAGTDVLAGDELGDFQLTPRGVLERDLYVTSLVEQHGAGLVVTLAGGYRADAWHCTANYVRWLLTGEAKSTRFPETDLARHYRRVARELASVELQVDPLDDLSFDESDLTGELVGGRRVRRFLDYYSVHGIELGLERYGLLERVRRQGFGRLRISTDTSEHNRHIARIHGVHAAHRDELLLVELVLSRRWVEPPTGLEPPTPLAMLGVEWLLMQNPTVAFSPARPRLPDQEHPGLGAAEEVQELLIRVCHRLQLEGVLNRPSHYHNAAIAGRQSRFLDPTVEGRFRALRRRLMHVPLHDASWMLERHELALADGSTMGWEPADQVLAVSGRLRRYFSSRAYKQQTAAAYQAWTQRLATMPTMIPPA